MAIDDKKLQEVEEKTKKILFDKIRVICSEQNGVISQIKELGKFVDLETNLPNIGITLNNKLVELQQQFQKAGISMYAERVEGYEMDYVRASFLGYAIMSDLLSYVSEGVQNLNDYSTEMKELTDRKVEKVQVVEDTSMVKRFFARIKNFFVPIRQEDLSYSNKEIESVNSYLSDYKETDEQVFKYNLRDNVISSIVRHIRDCGYSASTVPGLLEESIVPGLEKLGLADLMPQLKQELIEEYKKDLPGPEIYKVDEEYMHLYVPDFNREFQEPEEEVDLEELLRQIEQGSGEVDQSLEQNGVSLSDISSIDKTIDASDRQTTTRIIREEINPKLENSQDKKQGDIDIFID